LAKYCGFGIRLFSPGGIIQGLGVLVAKGGRDFHSPVSARGRPTPAGQHFPLKISQTGEKFRGERLKTPGPIGGLVEPFSASKVNTYA